MAASRNPGLGDEIAVGDVQRRGANDPCHDRQGDQRNRGDGAPGARSENGRDENGEHNRGKRKQGVSQTPHGLIDEFPRK